MEKRISRALLLCIVVLHSVMGYAEEGEAATTAIGDNFTVAVLPFQVRGDGLENMGEDIQALLTAQLSGNPGYLLVERAEIDKALSELELSLSGNINPETAAQIGQIVGAHILVTGRIFPVQKELALVGKMISTETSLVLGSTVSMRVNGSLIDASSELAEKLSSKLGQSGKSMVAARQLKEDVVASLLPLVKDKKLPTISIIIPETGLNKNVDAPSAQTEIGLILQQLGFELLDSAASNKAADIEISGDAFSEFGMRRGNLVSVKGRASIKAIDRRKGTVVVVDRETAVAVDLAPEIASKAALESCAQRLTERLVKQIAVQYL
jgi:hypothetical protein